MNKSHNSNLIESIFVDSLGNWDQLGSIRIDQEKPKIVLKWRIVKDSRSEIFCLYYIVYRIYISRSEIFAYMFLPPQRHCLKARGPAGRKNGGMNKLALLHRHDLHAVQKLQELIEWSVDHVGVVGIVCSFLRFYVLPAP